MEKEFTGADALKVIRQSIEQTREDLREKSLFYLLPGWAVFITAIVNFCLIELKIESGFSPTWTVLFLVALVPLLYNQFRSGAFLGEFNPDMTKSSLYYLWRGFSFTVLVVLLLNSGTNGNVLAPFSILISLLGLAAYVSGAILKFKPFIVGGYFSIFLLPILCANSIYIKTYPGYQLLVLAASVLCSFIIPAHILRIRK